MTRKTTTLIASFAILSALTIAIATAWAAGKIGYGHVINLADMQRMVTQRMSKEALLVALDIDKEQNLDNLKASRALFQRTMKGLRRGDMELGLPQTTDSNILSHLSEVDGLWLLFDTALQDSLSQNEFQRGQVSIIADLSLPLLNAVDGTVDSYLDAATKGNAFSMLGVAIELSGRQRMLTQKMTKEFLLIAYGLDAEGNKKNLAETIELFDTTLNALINGDFSRALLPPPSAQIRSQLMTVQQNWTEFKTIVLTAVKGGKPDPRTVAEVARKNVALLQEMHTAVQLYEAL